MLYTLLDILRELVREETQEQGIIKRPCYLSQSLEGSPPQSWSVKSNNRSICGFGVIRAEWWWGSNPFLYLHKLCGTALCVAQSVLPCVWHSLYCLALLPPCKKGLNPTWGPPWLSVWSLHVFHVLSRGTQYKNMQMKSLYFPCSWPGYGWQVSTLRLLQLYRTEVNFLYTFFYQPFFINLFL